MGAHSEEAAAIARGAVTVNMREAVTWRAVAPWRSTREAAERSMTSVEAKKCSEHESKAGFKFHVVGENHMRFWWNRMRVS